jgi:hypothetical protein
LALIHDADGPLRHEDGSNENAADGILVVQVRHLRAISGKISQPASLKAFMTPLVSEHSTIRQARLADG